MIQADLTDWEDLENTLALANRQGIPHATRNALNQAAFHARQESIENIKKEFTLRNKWTERGVIVKKAMGMNIESQESKVGATREYLADQETGATIRGQGKHGVSIPTSYSAGQQGQRPRTRLPRPSNRMQNIVLRRRRHIGDRKQRNASMVKLAARTGRKYVYLNTGRRKFIAKVIGGKRRPRVKMVQDLSRRTVSIAATPWLAPAVDDAVQKMPRFYADSLVFQLRRIGLLR